MSRTENSIRNIKYAVIGQAAGILISFISRRIFIQFLNEQYLGVDGLFTNILTMLSLAELGVGAAIVYSLYTPLAEGDVQKIKSLMYLFKRAYTVIGCVIGAFGLALTPALGLFVSEMPDIPQIRLTYILFVANSASSYFFSYKRSMIIADQKRYIATGYRYITYFFLSVAQIFVLVLTRNYILYLLIQIVGTVAENALISKRANAMYPYLKSRDIAPLNRVDFNEIVRNTGSMMLHKVGGVVVQGTDNLLLSKLVGVVAVGVYSNYYLIINAINIVVGLLTQSITASLGNLGATEAGEKKLEVFSVLNFGVFWIYGFSSICLLVLFNPFIELWLGERYLFDFELVIIIVVNFYVNGMRKGVLTNRDALGLYWADRYKPIFEALINLIVSIWLGLKFGAHGIFFGTVVSTLATCFWVEPYILYKYGFNERVGAYFKNYGEYTLICIIAGVPTYLITGHILIDGIGGLVVKFVICVTLPNLVFLLAFHRRAEFKYLWDLVKRARE